MGSIGWKRRVGIAINISDQTNATVEAFKNGICRKLFLNTGTTYQIANNRQIASTIKIRTK